MRKIVSTSALLIYLFGAIMLFNGCSDRGGRIRSDANLKSADNLFNAEEYDSALSGYLETAKQASAENNNSNLVEAYSQMARCYLKANNINEGSNWLEKAKSLASENEPLGWSRYLGVWGRFEWQAEAAKSGESAPVALKAEMIFKDMYAYCLANSLHERAVDAAHMIAIVGTKDERIAWGIRGIEAAEAGRLESWLGPLWNNHGWNLEEMGRYDEALIALKKAREYHYKGTMELPKLIADWSVGHAFRMTGDLDSAFSLMDQVVVWADSLYRQSPSRDHAEWLGFANKELGEIALAKGNRKDALTLFFKARIKLVEAGMPAWDKEGIADLETKISQLQ